MNKATINSKMEWARAVAEGDEMAFRYLFFHYRPRLISLIREQPVITQHPEEAVHELFRQLWENRRLLSGVINVDHYIFRTMLPKVYSAAMTDPPGYPDDVGYRGDAISATALISLQKILSPKIALPRNRWMPVMAAVWLLALLVAASYPVFWKKDPSGRKIYARKPGRNAAKAESTFMDTAAQADMSR